MATGSTDRDPTGVRPWRAGRLQARSETVSELLTRMREYASTHFASEEALMEAHGFPGREAHRGEHLLYRKRVAELCVGSMQGDEAMPQELLEYLLWWWRHHILEEDMRYAAYFRERGIVPQEDDR